MLRLCEVYWVLNSLYSSLCIHTTINRGFDFHIIDTSIVFSVTLARKNK